MNGELAAWKFTFLNYDKTQVRCEKLRDHNL